MQVTLIEWKGQKTLGRIEGLLWVFASLVVLLLELQTLACTRPPAWLNAGCSVRIADEGTPSVMSLGAAPRRHALHERGFRVPGSSTIPGQGGGGGVAGPKVRSRGQGIWIVAPEVVRAGCPKP